MNQQIELLLVQKTDFEELAAEIEAENKAANKERDRHVKCLEKIMLAYSYIRCVLESRPRNLTPKEVATIFNFINSVVLPKEQEAKKEAEEAREYTYFWVESWLKDSYTWFKYSITKHAYNGVISSKDRGHLVSKSSFWENWQKSNSKAERTLEIGRLEEDLWNYESGIFRYDELPEFIKTYPWVFPPNVVELHKEMIAMETKGGKE